MGYIQIDPKVDLLGIAGIPLFIVTILELRRTHELQAAELVRSHITSLLSNHDLYSAFHDLIYQYPDAAWEEVKRKVNEDERSNAEIRRRPEKRQEVWEGLKKINEDNSRQEGRRLYDPDFFQGSIEERRLDPVLQYFDIVAYNYRRGLISLDDIAGASAYHLAVIGSRDVIIYYLKRLVDTWDKLPYQKRIGAQPPFEHLRALLIDFEDYNKRTLGTKLKKRKKKTNYD